MTANPMFGVRFHCLWGLASARFYGPYKRVHRWSWEVFSIVGSVFRWIMAPWMFAAIHTEHLFNMLAASPTSPAPVVQVLGRNVGSWRIDIWSHHECRGGAASDSV